MKEGDCGLECPSLEFTNQRNTLRLVVDYSRSWQEKLATVRFGWVSPAFERNASYFPSPKGEGKKEVYASLFRFSSEHSRSEDVNKELIDKLNYQPATLDELIALGNSHPFYNNPYYDVVATGSPIVRPDGELLVPYIRGGNPEWRALELGSFDRYWGHFRFLLLRK